MESGYLQTTQECLQRLGLSHTDLERFVGLELAEARARAQTLGLTLFESVVDGEPRFRMMVIHCEWLSVVVENGTVTRVLGLG